KEAVMKRSASAVWKGGLKDGGGTVSTESGVLVDSQYSFGTRFENGKGTNPEELVAAAHAGCFSMALSGGRGKAGKTPEKIEKKSNLSFEKLDAGWTVTEIQLDLKAKVPGADKTAFQSAAETAKKNCPISRLLNTKITLNAALES